MHDGIRESWRVYMSYNKWFPVRGNFAAVRGCKV